MFLLPNDCWEIRESAKKGRGVYARTDIKPGTVIGDYLGKIIRVEDEEEYNKRYGLYARYFSSVATIYPDPNVPGVHMINHSCTPNCDVQSYEDHCLHYAIRFIYAGEELTVDYTIDPREGEDPMSDIACHCESQFCRGTMCTAPWLSDKLVGGGEDEDEDATSPVPFGEELPRLAAYPRTMSDDPLCDLYAVQDLEPVRFAETSLPSVRELRIRLRKTGRPLSFPKMGVLVQGVFRNAAVIKPLRKKSGSVRRKK